MKQNLKQSLKLSVITILIFGFAYPLIIFLTAQLTPEKSIGSPITVNGNTIGFENIGQSFTDDKYFSGRPSAVNYNAASTGGSNKGPTNPDYLAKVNGRIDSFLVHNPGIKKEDIPSELVTASGSGIDPNMSPQGAYVQIQRIAKIRNLDESRLRMLIEKTTEKKYLGFLGTDRINILRLNMELDKLK